MRSLLYSIPALLLLGLTFAACDSGSSPEASGRIRVLMTDAPADEFAHAYVTVVRVELVGEDGTLVTARVSERAAAELAEFRIAED